MSREASQPLSQLAGLEHDSLLWCCVGKVSIFPYTPTAYETVVLFGTADLE